MPDFTIPSFKYGMDQRRARAAGAISTLWDLGNAHITRGGDVQASKAFVPTYTLPDGCFGLAAIGSTLFTFGSADPPTMPPGVVYQQLIGLKDIPATGDLTFTALPGTSSTIVLNGTTWTFVSALTTGNQLLVGADLATTLAAAVTTLSETTDADTLAMTYTASATVLTATAAVGGTAGNSLTIQGSSGSHSTPTDSTALAGGAAGTAANMTRVVSAAAFIGKTYVIAEYDDGNLYHFYDGTRVTDWDAIASANCTLASLAGYLSDKVDGDSVVSSIAFGDTLLLTSRVPGVDTTVTASAVTTQTATVTTVQAAVAGAGEIDSTGTVTVTAGAANGSAISDVTIDGVSIIATPVAWFGSNSATANALAVQINNTSTTSGYFASSEGAVVTISGNPGQGATPNGKAVATTVTGSVLTTETDMAGGAAAVAAVAQVVSVELGGALLAASATTITVGDNTYIATTAASGTGTSIYVFQNRIYSTANTHLQYCTIADPSDWHNTAPSSGAGFINIASQTNGSERLTMVGAYAGYAAIFSARAVRLYQLTTDATAVTSFQSMQNQGSIAPLSLQSFATTDVFYLDLSGIRSLRERDTTFTAYAADVGSAVDTPVQDWIAEVGTGVAFNAVSIVEPLDGRYWLAIGTRIWVYSYFPSTQVGAWSHYDPGFAIQAFAAIKNKVYCYDGTTVYLYGGASGQEYPDAGDTPPTFTTPFHNPGNSGSSYKIETTIDVVATGVWKVDVFLNPNDLGEIVDGGTVVNNTYSGASKNVVGRSQLFSLRMTCNSGGYADFSSFTLNYLQKAAK